jgi:HK97 family phage prohead protease
LPSDKRLIFTADARFSVNQIAGKPVTLTGYPIVWNALSSDRGGYKVRLLPGSAKPTANVHALYHHEYRDILGDLVSNTLRILPADSYGIPVDIDLPDTSLGRDVCELVRTRRVRGMSFAMVDDPKGKRVTEDSQTILNVESFEYDEVTITGIAAFLQSSIELKDPAPPAGQPAPLVVVPAYGALAAQKLQIQRHRFNQLRL